MNARALFGSTSKTVTRRFEYDHLRRLVRVWDKIDTGLEILLHLNAYNELGQPTGKLNEAWTEQVVTIPGSGGSVPLTVGVKWDTATSGDRFYLNEMEVIERQTITPEYQYNLKDHLGNVRVTFTSKNETESVTVTLETAPMTTEKANFLRYDNAKRVNASIFDHTNGASPGYSQRLSGRHNEKYGLARSLSVMPGDVIDMEVYVKYVDPVAGNRTTALNTRLSQIAANGSKRNQSCY